MKSKALWWAAGIMAASAIAVGCAGALAQDPPPTSAAPVHFNGVINDYPVSTTSSGGTIGPWEVRGPWFLNLQGFSGTASFSAALTMELDDLSVGGGATADARNQHTHHITMTGATVSENFPQGDCPSATGFPTYSSQLEVTGMADVTGNGGSPFGSGVLVPLKVCIGGGSNLQFSNIQLVFTKNSDGTPSAATLHFGAQPLHGVVSTTN
jgi:hypothetical protein